MLCLSTNQEFFAKQKERRQTQNGKKTYQIEQVLREFEKRKRGEKEHRERKETKRRKLEEAEKEIEFKRIALISPLKVGTRVTIFGYSRNKGDATVTAHYPGDEKNCIPVE